MSPTVRELIGELMKLPSADQDKYLVLGNSQAPDFVLVPTLELETTDGAVILGIRREELEEDDAD